MTSPAAPKLQNGYAARYRAGEANRCPACDRSNWWIGRSTAECAFCAAVLFLPETVTPPRTINRRGTGGGIVRHVLEAA